MRTTRLELRIAIIAAMKNVLSPISDNKIIPHDLRKAYARTKNDFTQPPCTISRPLTRQPLHGGVHSMGCQDKDDSTYLKNFSLVKCVHYSC